MQLVVHDFLTTYGRVGSGKRQVLILHGWGDSSAGWRQFAAALGKDYDVVSLDLPGFGGTQAPQEPWGLGEYADFVAAFIEKAKLKPYAVIGHSNGGAIAIRGLGQNKFQAEKLVLLASAGIRNEYNGRNKALRLITKAGKAATAPLPQAVRKKIQKKVYTTIGSDMLVVEHMQETFKRVVTDDVREDAAQITVPTLLVYGENDTAAPVRYGELFHEAIDGSTLEILPGVEHFLHLEQPQKVVQLVQDFLR